MDFIFNTRNFLHSLAAFLAAVPLGFLTSLAVPQLANAYAAFMRTRIAGTLLVPEGTTPGLPHMLIILVNNLIPVIVGFALPPLIVAYNLRYANSHPEKYLSGPRSGPQKRDRLRMELRFNLSAFGFSMAFAFGFFVFGLFPGFVLRSLGATTLTRLFLGATLHAPLEIIAVLLSASVAFSLRDLLIPVDQREQTPNVKHLKESLRSLIKSKQMTYSIGLVIFLLILGSFLEVLVSPVILPASGQSAVTEFCRLRHMPTRPIRVHPPKGRRC